MRTNYLFTGAAIVVIALAGLAAVVVMSPSAIFTNNVEDCPPVVGGAEHLNYSAGDANLTCETNYETDPLFDWVRLSLTPTIAPGVSGSGIYWTDSAIGVGSPRMGISSFEIAGTPLPGSVQHPASGLQFSESGSPPYASFYYAGGSPSVQLENTTDLIGLDSTDPTVPGSGPWLNQGGGTVTQTQFFMSDAAFAYGAVSAACPGGGGDPAVINGTAQLYSKLCLGAPNITELFTQDDAGNVTQLSTHDGDVWKFDSYNRFTGRRVVVDMESLVSAIETLTGETFMSVTVGDAELDWNVEQQRQRQDSIAARQDWAKRRDSWNANIEYWNILNPDNLRTDPYPIPQPELYVPKDKPQWLLDREAALGR